MRHILILTFSAAAWAQQTVAPTPAPVGPARGENSGGYNILNSFETGWRFRVLNGDEGRYRSNVNYGNGVRLLASGLRVNSRDGHGRLFDELSIQTLGLGNDPYEYASLRLEKNRLYRYDLAWRLLDYYNPALPAAQGLHLMDTRRTLQDHDFTLFPQSPVKLFVGYSRNRQSGPALSTEFFPPVNAAFPLASDIRRLQNEYRFGGELNLFGARVTILRGWSNFSENTAFENAGGQTRQSRTEPYRGSSPYWRLNLHKEAASWAAVARYSHASADRRFFFDELTSGTAFGSAVSRQTLISGTARRPAGTGSLALSFFPVRDVTVTNTTSFYNTRMDGDNFFTEVFNQTGAFTTLNFQLLGIRTIANLTDAGIRFAPWISAYGGYHYSTRRIRSTEQVRAVGAPEDTVRAEQDNTLHSGLFGLRFTPGRGLAANIDAEVGRADRPFYPISERRYHLLGGRVQYRARNVTLSAQASSNYKTSSVTLSEHSSRARNYMLDASWAPRDWFSFDAGYSKQHLDTLSGIAYFANFQLTPDHSFYISNLHTAYLTTRFAIRSRADLSIGYTRVQDTGDGRDRPDAASRPAALAPFSVAQTYPVTYETPLARLSVRMHEKLRFNVGWQFYHFDEKWLSAFAAGLAPNFAQRYSAHVGYTSVLWSF